MIRNLIEALLKKPSTTKYPYEKIVVAEDFRGKPEIDFIQCMGCGACAQVCPSNAITIQDNQERGIRIWKIFYGRCILCGRCEEVCPIFAIKQTEEFELAAKKKEDLEHVIHFRLATCKECGKYREVTKREVMRVEVFLKRALGELFEENLHLCRECKFRETILSIAKATKPGIGEEK